MRLSEIKGEQALDCVEAIVGPIASIASDDEFKKLLSSGGSFSDKASSVSKYLLSKHRDDTVAILAALSLQTPKEYLKGVTLPKMIADVYSVITDEELLGFLPQEQQELGTTSEDTLED